MEVSLGGRLLGLAGEPRCCRKGGGWREPGGGEDPLGKGLSIMHGCLTRPAPASSKQQTVSRTCVTARLPRRCSLDQYGSQLWHPSRCDASRLFLLNLQTSSPPFLPFYFRFSPFLPGKVDFETCCLLCRGESVAALSPP